jgi:hypothetical protein
MTLRDLAYLLLGLLLALAVGSLAEDRLSRVESEYAAGTYLAHQADYQHLYANSAHRSLALSLVRSEGATDITIYRAAVDGRDYVGVLLIDFEEDDNAVRESEYPAPLAARVDQARAGQLADVAMTALGIGAGAIVEGNPLMSPLTASAGGWGLLVGAKLALASWADRQDFRHCVAWRSAISQLGWTGSAWTAGIALHPVVALAGAVGVWKFSDEPALRDTVARCLQAPDEQRA